MTRTFFLLIILALQSPQSLCARSSQDFYDAADALSRELTRNGSFVGVRDAAQILEERTSHFDDLELPPYVSYSPAVNPSYFADFPYGDLSGRFVDTWGQSNITTPCRGDYQEIPKSSYPFKRVETALNEYPHDEMCFECSMCMDDGNVDYVLYQVLEGHYSTAEKQVVKNGKTYGLIKKGMYSTIRSDPAVRKLVALKDAEWVNDYAKYIQGNWSEKAHLDFERYNDLYDDYWSALDTRYSDLATSYGLTTFHAPALCSMVRFGISAWQVQHALHHGNQAPNVSQSFFATVHESRADNVRIVYSGNILTRYEILAVVPYAQDIKTSHDETRAKALRERKIREQSARISQRRATEEIARTATCKKMVENLSPEVRKNIQDVYANCLPENYQAVATRSPEINEFFNQRVGLSSLLKHAQEFNQTASECTFKGPDENVFHPSALCAMVDLNISPADVLKIREEIPFEHDASVCLLIDRKTDLCTITNRRCNEFFAVFKNIKLAKQLATINGERTYAQELWAAKNYSEDLSDIKKITIKLGSFSKASLCELSENYLNDLQHPTPTNWVVPKNLNNAENLTFNGWNFRPAALFGMMVCNVTPSMATTAVESALSTAGSASTFVRTASLAPAITINPTLACVALAGAGALVIYDNAQKIITNVLQATKYLEEVITSCISLISACMTIEPACVVDVGVGVPPEVFLDIFRGDVPMGYYVMQAREQAIQAELNAQAKNNEPSGSGGGQQGPNDPKKPNNDNKKNKDKNNHNIPRGDFERPEDKEALDEIEQQIEKGSHRGTEPHILQEKHLWDKLIKNYKENWPEVRRIIARTIKNGLTEKQDPNNIESAIVHKLKIHDEIVEVRTFSLPDGSIRITTAMVQW